MKKRTKMAVTVILVLVGIAVVPTAAADAHRLDTFSAKVEARSRIVYFWASQEWTKDYYVYGCSRRSAHVFGCTGQVEGTVTTYKEVWVDPPPGGGYCNPGGQTFQPCPVYVGGASYWVEPHDDPPYQDLVAETHRKFCILSVTVKLKRFFIRSRLRANCTVV